MAIVQKGKTYLRFRENRHLLIKETKEEVKALLNGADKFIEVTVVEEQTKWKSPLPSDTKADKVLHERKALVNAAEVIVVGDADALKEHAEF